MHDNKETTLLKVINNMHDNKTGEKKNYYFTLWYDEAFFYLNLKTILIMGSFFIIVCWYCRIFATF